MVGLYFIEDAADNECRGHGRRSISREPLPDLTEREAAFLGQRGIEQLSQQDFVRL
jgi:hypothetical protein